MPSFLNSKITTIVLSILCGWLLLLAVTAGVRHGASTRALEQVNDRIAADERDSARLAGEIARMKRPAWLALLARSRLNYKRPDETVVFVYKSEKAGTISQPQVSGDERPNWRKWWDWIADK